MHTGLPQHAHERQPPLTKLRLLPQLTAASVVFASAAMAAEEPPVNPHADKEEWVELFNGRNLDGWKAKIAGHDFGVNFANTFRVEDGIIKVRYDQYDGFNHQYGLLFYKEPYAYYRLIVEYRFVGEQADRHPGAWAHRNSGVMVHTQAGETMTRTQNFPISIEAQFLGGLSDGKARSTMNMCSPGTHIVYQGRFFETHCLSSSSKTFDGDQWVQAELRVLGPASITHFVNGEQVLEYSLPQVGGGLADNADPQQLARAGEVIDHGYIALQSESHPIDFRRVAILNLAGCTDRKASNYKSYYVKSEPSTCRYAAAQQP